MSAAAAEAMISSELWVSFISLMRSYAAAASLNSSGLADVAAAENSISIAVGDARLEMHCEAATGAGRWSLRSGSHAMQGRFELLPEGRIEVDGTVLDLDHAAIDFAALVMQAAAKSAREE